jgi:hypothetical protein
MDFITFVRRPFVVEAVLITEDNIEEIAPFVGEIRTKEGGTKKYIQVDRRLVPNLFRVFPGYWMTRMDDNIRCYAPKVFAQQFAELTPEIKEWVDWMQQPESEEEDPRGDPIESQKVGPYERIIKDDADVEELPQPEADGSTRVNVFVDNAAPNTSNTP